MCRTDLLLYFLHGAVAQGGPKGLRGTICVLLTGKSTRCWVGRFQDGVDSAISDGPPAGPVDVMVVLSGAEAHRWLAQGEGPAFTVHGDRALLDSFSTAYLGSTELIRSPSEPAQIAALG